MTEKEKMVRQMMYDANYDEEILADRDAAKEMCYDYNMLRPSEKNRLSSSKNCSEKQEKTSSSRLRSGAITDIILRSAKTSMPTITWSSLTAQK